MNHLASAERGRSGVVPALLCVLLAGCATRMETSRAPVPGRYAYIGTYVDAEAASPRSFSGVLHITAADEDRVQGRWEVAGYDPAVQLGSFVDGAFQVNADVSTEQGVLGTFRHRISRAREPARLRCAGTFLRREAVAGQALPATCSLRYLGP